jgi:Condensation domain
MNSTTQIDGEVKRKLLEICGQSGHRIGNLHANTIVRRPKGTNTPLSLMQEHLWVQERMFTEARPYNESVTIKATEWLDPELLKRALYEISRRHEIWRTSYNVKNEEAIQVVHPDPLDFPWQVIDLRDLTDADRAAEFTKVTNAMVRQRFDLQSGPLLRGMVVRLTDTDQRLFLCAHLSIVDGLSVYQILPGELATLYEAYARGCCSPLPPLAIQYGDYARWQREWMKTEEPRSHEKYWQQQLQGDAGNVNWRDYTGRSPQPTWNGKTEPFAIGQQLTHGLQKLARTSGVTLFTVLLASFSTVLASYTQKMELLIGAPSSGGRKRPEVRKLIGNFLTNVVLCIDLRGNITFQELLRRTQREIAEALTHDDVSIDLLSRRWGDIENTGAKSISTAISLQPETPKLNTGWQVSSMDADNGGAAQELYVAFLGTPTGMMGRVQYNIDLFDAEMIAGIIGDLRKVMTLATEGPDKAVSSIINAIQPGPFCNESAGELGS